MATDDLTPEERRECAAFWRNAAKEERAEARKLRRDGMGRIFISGALRRADIFARRAEYEERRANGEHPDALRHL